MSEPASPHKRRTSALDVSREVDPDIRPFLLPPGQKRWRGLTQTLTTTPRTTPKMPWKSLLEFVRVSPRQRF